MNVNHPRYAPRGRPGLAKSTVRHVLEPFARCSEPSAIETVVARGRGSQRRSRLAQLTLAIRATDSSGSGALRTTRALAGRAYH